MFRYFIALIYINRWNGKLIWRVVTQEEGQDQDQDDDQLPSQFAEEPMSPLTSPDAWWPVAA